MQLATNAWYVVLSADEVPRDRPVAFRRLGHDLVFWRRPDGRVAGALDRCPHRLARLSDGRLEQGELECPFHGFRFDGSGACTAIPAHPGRRISGAMHLDTLELREEHGFVWAWTGPDAAPADPVPFFDFGDLTWRGSQARVPVANHYTRAVENQLDFPHLPFVHRTTIGRLVKVEMDVVTEVEGDRIRAWLRDDDGGLLELIAPCLWRLRTGPTWQFLAFVPIDEGRMLYYQRTYRRALPVPGMDPLVGWVAKRMNAFVIHQDTPLVEGQPVGEARLRMGEVLVPSDGPIIAWRRWREARRAPFQPGRRLREAAEEADRLPA